MFHGKPTFGQSSTNTGFGFTNAATASPFGQTQFGKPTTGGFGQAPAFGQQNTSLFGSTQPAGGGLFGANTSTSFGAPATTQQPAFGGFQQPAQNTSLFGTTQPNAAPSTLFGQSSTSAFGAAKPSGFGFGQTQPTTSLFGQSSTANTSQQAFGGFGQNTTSGGVFGATASTFGQQTQNAGANGTALVKYQPSIGTDTLMKNGQANNVNTKQHCITAMKEYEAKSLEELRLEDYLANRKGPQAGTTAGLFGQAPAAGGLFGSQQQSTGLFGQQTENKGLFGATNTIGGTGFGQPANTGFGATSQASTGMFPKPFSTPATSSTGFGFGATDTSNNLFGAKPFGQPGTTGLFGQPAQPAPGFGQTNTSFGGFGAPNANPQPSLFGTAGTDNKPAPFGLASSAPNTGFGGFGTSTTSTAGGGLFGTKPATGFGTNTGFGITTSTSSGFGGFGTTNTGSSIFNTSLNKPAAPAFGGFGTQTSTAPIGGGLNFGTGNQSLFGNNANKPGGLFGTPGQSANTGLFNSGTTFGNTNTLGGFGTTNLGVSNSIGGIQQQTSIPIHQQIMALATSPYGDNPIFKDLKPSSEDQIDALKPTNPAAQKVILESTSNQFKVSPKMSNGIKVKPVGNVMTKKSLFEGLEEYDSTVEESFSLKPNAKRLIIKPKSNNASLNATASPSLGVVSKNSTPDRNGNLNSSHIKSRIGTNSGSSTPTGQQSKNEESFQNEIPLTAPAALTIDLTRRESWLHPNALDKVKERNQMSDSIMDNTLSELVPSRQNEMKISQTDILKTKVGFTDSTNLKSANYAAQTSNDSIQSSRSLLEETNPELLTMNFDPHPTGIVLRRVGYYTIPSLDELTSYISEDGTCIVPNFTIGREGYGNVFFNEPIDVTGLNLDEIVHFRHKEVIIYPDDENKPPVGCGLNRKAQITLDQVWPHDKTIHEPIKDPERLDIMDYEGKLRRVCDKHDTRFIEYRAETGSWVFKVDHFSKYGLSDSDEDDVPTDPKKQKLGVKPGDAKQKDLKNGTGKVTDVKMKMVNLKKSEQEFGLKENDGNLVLPNEPQQFLHDDDFNVDLTRTISSSKITPTSPTAALAMGASTDSHKLQLMKASFFIDEDLETKSVLSENFDGRDSPDQIVPTRSYARSQGFYSSTHSLSKDLGSVSSASGIDAMEISPLPKRLFDEPQLETDMDVIRQPAIIKPAPLIIKPKVATIKITDIAIPFEESIGYQLKGKCLADMALFNCRRFKIGFGPQNNLLMLSTINNVEKLDKELNIDSLAKFFEGRLKFDKSKTVLQNLKISSAFKIESFEESIIDHLRIQLKYSLRDEVPHSDCPYIKCDGGTELLAEHLELSKSISHLGSYEEYAVSVWSLCQALWGEQEELEGQEPTSHLSIMCRRNLFSEWLEDTVTEKNILKKTISKSDYLNHLLELLMCHKVVDACELAFNNDDVNLSLLLAQLSGGPTIRQLVQHQLSSWQKVEADKFIAIERLKMLMLVAGVSLMSSAHGPVNIFDGVHWMKSLALHLWYICSPTSSITDALLAYESSYQSDEFYAMPPSPVYSDRYEVKSAYPLQDLRYHILKLYSKRSHPLEKLLNPASHTPDPLDYRLSWLLLQTFETLGYHHCSELAASRMHVSFASQLENYGLWHWAIFVLLHIKNKNRRELCVQDILYRYVSLSHNDIPEKEKFVINDLGIPQKWIDWAKAVKAGAHKNYHLQAKYLLKAKQWSMAHDVIMQHIAPDAIINDNIKYLHMLLNQFEDPRQVSNWVNQGQTILDFIEMNEKFESLKTVHAGDIETRWESVKPQLADLCSRINLLPCPTPKHRLCQSEIAQKLACLVRGVLLTCPVLNPCLLIKIALEKLPLPQEYAQQELRVLLDTFVGEMFKSNMDCDDVK